MFDFEVLRGLRRREGLTIAEVSNRSGVSPAVISKLERNQSMAELETLFKLSRVYGISATDLLSLAEQQASHRAAETHHAVEGFDFRQVAFGNVRCLHSSVGKGSRISRPEIHQDDYEVCWVLSGAVRIILPNERHDLAAGAAIQFDAILEHTYEALEDSELMILHLNKGKRF